MPDQLLKPSIQKKRNSIMWTKPAYTDLRIGFEVTMYFANR
ncbi:pyrroloquinoline quinone biosynthesis protein A [Pseudomonas sp. IT-P218]|jgi:pyrroloquinoline quinone biosynthesis protein A